MLRRTVRAFAPAARLADGSIGSNAAWAEAKHTAVARCTDASVLTPSIIPTRHFQRSLPRLPVPLLSNSLARYAAAVKPLVPPTQYERTVRLLKEFESKDGGRLQDELVKTDRANQHTSFVSSDWFERVLKERDPIPLRRSRTLVVRSPDTSNTPAALLDMLPRATLWIRSSVLYYKAYLDNTLYPDVRYTPDDAKAYYQQDWFERTIALCPEYVSASVLTLTSGHHAHPLDMSQCDNLFNSTRAPGVLQDEVRAVGFMPHIVVQYRGRQFAVTVADDDSNPLPEDQIYARLRAIVTSPAATSRPRVDMGVFTTLPRTEWNGVRTALLRHATNQKSLETLDSSMFILNLDDSAEPGFFDSPRTSLQKGMAKVGNRWWDKSFSVNVGARGALSVSYEESWGDGAAVRRYVEDVFQHTMQRMQGGTPVVDSSKATEPVRELQWALTPELEQLAANALRRYQQDIARLDLSVGVLGDAALAAAPSAGRSGSHPMAGSAPTAVSAISGHACSLGADDGVMQLALQLAWWRLYTSPVAAAQPLLMNAFRRGRMDNVYLSSAASQAFVLALAASSSSVSETEKRERCRAAREAHTASVKEVLAGGGIAAHFIGLRNVAERMFGRTPAIFTDPSYRLLASPQLVVRSEGSPALAAVTSTPVSNGYGVTYTTVTNPETGKQNVILNVSSWNGADGPRYSASDFVAAVTEAVEDIRPLLK